MNQQELTTSAVLMMTLSGLAAAVPPPERMPAVPEDCTDGTSQQHVPGGAGIVRPNCLKDKPSDAKLPRP